MITQYNRQTGKIFPLTQRGFIQAERNNSHQIWNLLSWEQSTDSLQHINQKQHQQTFQTTLNDHNRIPLTETNNIQDLSKDNNFQLTKNQTYKQAKDKSPSLAKDRSGQDKSTRANSFLRSAPQPLEKINKETAVESELDRLKRKSIQKYLKDQVPYTRTMSNSAFRKFYQRPCPEAYGNKNTHTERGAFYGNFMKTHNVQPHTLDNKPQNYQTYSSALNFGKRTKLDLEDRWKRIERQLANNLDYRQVAYMKAVGEVQMDDNNKQDILKANVTHYGQKEGKAYEVAALTATSKSAKSLGKMDTRATLGVTMNGEDASNTQQQKRRSSSSDRPLYYVYKYQESSQGYNSTRYARDRHGITCYVDSAFRENEEALTNFYKKIKQIHPDKCKPEDVNIDSIRILNNQKVKEEVMPRHYLVANVDVPYIPNKYSRKIQSTTRQN